MGNAALNALKVNACVCNDLFERAVAVRTKRNELLHIALKSEVVAVG